MSRVTRLVQWCCFCGQLRIFQWVLEHQSAWDLPLHMLRHASIWVSLGLIFIRSYLFCVVIFFFEANEINKMMNYSVVVQVFDEVRQWNRLAVLLWSDRKQCKVKDGLVDHLHAKRGSALLRLRCSSRPCLQRRPAAHWQALLHQQVCFYFYFYFFLHGYWYTTMPCPFAVPLWNSSQISREDLGISPRLWFLWSIMCFIVAIK